MGERWGPSHRNGQEDYMKHAATVERLRDQIPAPDETILVFWPCDNGKGYFADIDNCRVPYSQEDIEQWESGAPGRRAIIVGWGKQGVTHE